MGIIQKQFRLGDLNEAAFFIGGTMDHIISAVNNVVWGVPVLVMILGTGAYLSIATGFAQLRLFPRAVKSFLQKLRCPKEADGVSPYQALCTALAATVGTGNIAGVAGAIALGGPGSIFWMWLCAVFGMITKFSEAVLAVHYRKSDGCGGYMGGPMYVIENGLGRKWSWLGKLYCFFGVVAALGVGNATQIDAVIGGARDVAQYFGRAGTSAGDLCIGIIAAALLLTVLLGGAQRIGQFAETLVPFAAVAYLLLCMGALVANAERIPDAFTQIITAAFSPQAVTGGVLGSVFISLRVGVSRGVFTNEAGMGTAGIAHGAATVSHPVEQGYMGIMEVFLDTIVICTMTALVILSSPESIPYGTDVGVRLTTRAFAATYGSWVSIPISLFLCCFAFATMIGWGLYGMRCAEYLFGKTAWKTFAVIQAVVLVVSTLLKTETIWTLAETVNGLMAIPNLIALCLLCPVVVKLTSKVRSLPAPGLRRLDTDRTDRHTGSSPHPPC